MSFSLDAWKEKASIHLRQIGDWLKRPQTWQFMPVTMVLESVAIGVGGNLLAEQVQGRNPAQYRRFTGRLRE